MPADQPFEANIGDTISVLGVSTSGSPGTVTISSSLVPFAPSLMVTNTATTILFFRLDNANVTTATSIDIPIPGSTSRIFANPVPIGPTYISVTASISVCGGAGTLFITPGQGGIE